MLTQYYSGCIISSYVDSLFDGVRGNEHAIKLQRRHCCSCGGYGQHIRRSFRRWSGQQTGLKRTRIEQRSWAERSIRDINGIRVSAHVTSGMALGLQLTRGVVGCGSNLVWS